jgi:hypothetical protein
MPVCRRDFATGGYLIDRLTSGATLKTGADDAVMKKLLYYWVTGVTIIAIGQAAILGFLAVNKWNPEFVGDERPLWWQITKTLIYLGVVILAPLAARWLAGDAVRRDGGLSRKLSGTEQSVAYGESFSSRSKQSSD